LTDLRDQLKAGLYNTASQAHDEKGPAVAELAERIKALKAANTIEVTPQRTRQKQSTAEEPGTARIRRRQKANGSAGEVVQADGEWGVEETLQPTSSHGKTPMSFR
jgi:hypothetical protein